MHENDSTDKRYERKKPVSSLAKDHKSCVTDDSRETKHCEHH